MPILKHFDFEVPSFGEFVTPPATPALTQQLGASPPQLPGQTVLRIDTTGTFGTLTHDLGSAFNALHTRIMLNVSQATGGLTVLAGTYSASNAPVWLLTYAAPLHQISLAVGGKVRSVNLPTAFDWHVIEVALNVTAGTIKLRLNGIERDSTTVSVSAVRYAWVGNLVSYAGMSGTIDIDHWTLATAPIGVPVATPIADDASDPRRWLVIYHRDHADSAAWAEAYRDRRGVPYANLCGLALPSTETITAAQYETMRQQIDNYLNDNLLSDQIVGLLLGFGVPGYADVAGQSTLTPIASYLHTNDTHGFTVVNPLHQDPITQRPAADHFTTVRLTGRIDAPDLATALSLLDRADNLIHLPLAHDQGAELRIDINPETDVVGPTYTGSVEDWALGHGLAQLRLPATIYDESAPGSVSSDAVVWGWRDAAPPSGFFREPAGRRAVCQQFSPDAQHATSVRSASATDWLVTSLQAGYAAAAAPSRSFSLSALPLPHLFFEALRRGWTIAEAWLVAMPFLRDGLQLIGDPLLTIGFPKAGFDVFGPVDRLDQIDFDQPLAVLHAGQFGYQLAPGDAPSAQSPKRFLVRRYDADGRPDLASATTFAVIEQSQVVRPAPPAWPAFDGWRVRLSSGRLQLIAAWPCSLVSLNVDQVQLYAQAGSGEPALIGQAMPKPGQREVAFVIDRPSITSRYRLRVVQGPAVFDTPWSAWVAPAPSVTQSLTLLEVQP